MQYTWYAIHYGHHLMQHCYRSLCGRGLGQVVGNVNTSVVLQWYKTCWFILKQHNCPEYDTYQYHDNEFGVFNTLVDAVAVTFGKTTKPVVEPEKEFIEALRFFV